MPIPSLRRFALLAALLAVTAGVACAPDRPAVTDQVVPSAPAATETDPGVVVVLDDFAAANVLALGVTPDLAYDAFGYTTTAALYDAARVTPKPYGQSLNVEEIAAADPDVIVGVSLPTTVEQKDALAELGTTAILEYTGDWRAALRATAAALGREDRAARVEALVDSGVTSLRDDLAGAGQSGAVVSVLAGSTDGAFSPPVKTSLGSLIAGLGLERPAPQRADVSAAAPFVNISPESLTANDGAALFLMTGRSYPVEGITGSPLYPRLKAVQAGRAYQVSGEMWFGASPLSVRWVLDDLRRTLLEDADPLPESAAGERLQALVAATDDAR